MFHLKGTIGATTNWSVYKYEYIKRSTHWVDAAFVGVLAMTCVVKVLANAKEAEGVRLRERKNADGRNARMFAFMPFLSDEGVTL